jgi:hypothetical protein
VEGQAPDRAEYRIYRVIETGDIQLFAERGDLAFKFGGRSSDGARSPQVSADGETVALTLQGICESISGCTSNSRWHAEIRGRYASVLGDGAVYLSGNARWALFVPHGIPGMNTAAGASPLLINLETGDRGSVPPLSPFSLPATRLRWQRHRAGHFRIAWNAHKCQNRALERRQRHTD